GCRSFAAGLRAGADECVLPPHDDLDAARRLVATTARAVPLPYPGDRHLLAGDGLPDDDRGTATPLRRRVLDFLDDIG
ncbi:MAG TPA: hypothetical protein VLA98_12240, partial [Solirubrobacteraceae bacterium]|nr:hypothetical protein [Solirubrobacteraceae bacterium]